MIGDWWHEYGEDVKDWLYGVLTIAVGVALGGVIASLIIWFALA